MPRPSGLLSSWRAGIALNVLLFSSDLRSTATSDPSAEARRAVLASTARSRGAPDHLPPAAPRRSCAGRASASGGLPRPRSSCNNPRLLIMDDMGICGVRRASRCQPPRGRSAAELPCGSPVARGGNCDRSPIVPVAVVAVCICIAVRYDGTPEGQSRGTGEGVAALLEEAVLRAVSSSATSTCRSSQEVRVLQHRPRFSIGVGDLTELDGPRRRRHPPAGQGDPSRA